MKEFIEKILTNAKWFLLFVAVLIVLTLFFWRIIDIDSYRNAIHGFMNDIFQFLKLLFVIAIVIFGFRIMLKGFDKKN